MCFFFLLRHAACRILVPRAGTEPTPSAVKALNLNHWTAREVPEEVSFKLLKNRKELVFRKVCELGAGRWMNIPEKESSKCKGPEAGQTLACVGVCVCGKAARLACGEQGEKWERSARHPEVQGL